MGVPQRASITRWAPVAGLVAIIVAGATIGFAVSRRPSAAPPPPPTPRPEAPTPRSAFGYSVSDDPIHGEVVLFGGVDTYDQTWLWNGQRWAQAHPASSPPGRFDSPAAYDPATGQVLIFGGRLADGEVAGDTWAWDGTTWTEVDAGSAAGPPAGDGGAMAWDDALGTMVLIVPLATPGGASGETWVWTGTHWNGLAGANFPLGVQPVAAAFDPVSLTLVAVGGEATRAPGGVLAFVPLRWVDGTWTIVQTSEHLDSFAGLAQDPVSGRLIVAAANGFPRVATTSTAWSWTGGNWQLVNRTSGPPWPQAEATDQTRGRLLLFATLLGPSQDTPQYVHVWAWQGTKWRRLDGG